MKSRGVWGRVSRVYACALGMVVSVGCGESGDSTDRPESVPEPAPSLPVDAGTGTEGRDGGGTPPDAGPEVDGGTSSGPDAGGGGDAGTPDGGDGGPPGGGDGGTDGGTPGGNDGGTDGGTPPPVEEPPVTGGPAQRGKHWRASYYAGVAPGGLAVGDFNNDGAPDVAVNDLGAGFSSQYRPRSGSLVVLLNDGKGALQKPSTRRKLHSSSGRIAAGYGDMNGTLDLVLGTRYGAWFLAGSAAGTFEDAPVYLSHGEITHLGFWPGEGDDAPRVWAVGSSTDGNDGPRTEGGFHVLVHTETGLLWPRGVNRVDQTPVILPLDDRTAAAVADFDRNGLMDVALASERWPLTRFFGTEAQTFTDLLLVDWRPDHLSTADLNGDGNPDLVAVKGKELWTHLGLGNGNFTEGVMTRLPTAASHLVMADVDADSRPDAVLLHRDTGQISLWPANPVGTFNEPMLLATGRQPTDAAVADLDRDGTPELLVAEAGDNVVSVYAIPGKPVAEAPFTPHCPLRLRDVVAGGSAPAPLLSMDAGVGTDTVSVGDFDGDGHPDLALKRADQGVRLLLGQADGTLRIRDTLTDWQVNHLAAGDFNGDGLSDLALVLNDTPGLMLRWGDAETRFEEGASSSAYPDYGGYITAADFNRDGRMDLGASLNTPCTSAGMVLMNEGGGVLRTERLTDHNTEPDDQCGYNGVPTVADFNGDGTLDILHQTLALNLNYTTAAGKVQEGEGFDPMHMYGAEPSAGDMDGDGRADLVLSKAGALHVLRGDGGGTLESSLACPLKAAGQAQLEAVDVNGDGIMDLLGRDASGAVVVVPGKGGGEYLPVRRYPLEGKPVWAGPVNLRGDAKPELVVLLASGTLKVFPAP